MTLEGLPKEVVEGCVPILQKYDVEQKMYGFILTDMGKVFTEIANMPAVKSPSRQKVLSQLMVKRTLRILNARGMKGAIDRAKCAQELLEFLISLLQKEAKKNE